MRSRRVPFYAYLCVVGFLLLTTPLFSDDTQAFYAPPWPSSPPTDPTNCADRLAAYDFQQADQLPVRVWWIRDSADDATLAAKVMNEVTNNVWPALAKLFARTPLPDDYLPCNGGSADFDIYITNACCTTIPYLGTAGDNPKLPCGKTPVFIAVGAFGGDDRKLQRSLAHELTHAFINAYSPKGCLDPEYYWLNEATATWAIEYLYHDNNLEHDDAPGFLDMPFVPLEGLPASGHSLRDYGDYIFLFFMARRESPDVVRQIWEASESNDNSLAAVDSVIGGFQGQWPDFVGYNWNREPANYYLQWDQLESSAKPEEDDPVLLDPDGTHAFPLDGNIQHLAAKYYHFTFVSDDVRTVSFFNPFFQPRMPDAHVRAFVKIADQPWIQEDWSDRSGRTFCRDTRAERIQELVIMISNSQWSDRTSVLQPPWDPVLKVSNIGCWKWQGTITATTTWGDGTTERTQEEIVLDWNADPYLDPQIYPPLSWRFFHTESLNASWSVDGGNCAPQGSGSFNLDSTTINQFNDLTMHYFFDPRPVGGMNRQRQYEGLIILPEDLRYTINFTGSDPSCALNNYFQNGRTSSLFWTAGSIKVDTDGTHIQGTATGGSTVWDWDLHSQTEQ